MRQNKLRGKSMKYIYKYGDVTDLYIVGENVRMKWHHLWCIMKVKYDARKNITSIKLRRVY